MAMDEDENLSNARRVGLVVVFQLNSLSLDQPPPPQQPCPPLLLARTRCWQMALQARESVELVARVREEGTRSRQAREVSWPLSLVTAVVPCKDHLHCPPYIESKLHTFIFSLVCCCCDSVLLPHTNPDKQRRPLSHEPIGCYTSH